MSTAPAKHSAASAHPLPRLREDWLLLLLTAALLLLFLLSLEGAPEQNSSLLVRTSLLGTVFGLLLAFSRFSGLQAAPYSLALSLPVCIQLSVSLFPPAAVSRLFSFIDWLQYTHWRLTSFLGQLPDWIGPSNLAAASQRTALLLALVSWQAVVWLLWWLLRKSNALAALLPVGAFFAFNMYSLGNQTFLLSAFLFTCLLLMAAVSYRRQHRDWYWRRRSYPQEMGEWPLSALLLAALIVLFARFTAVLGTAQGRQNLVELFQRPAPPAESSPSFQQDLETFNTPPQIWSGISDLSSLDTPPSTSSTTVMWVRIRNDGSSEAASAYYLRGQIFDRYTGRGWQSAALLTYPQTGTFIARADCSGQKLEQEYEILALHDEILFGINVPVSSSQDAPLFFFSPDNSALLRGEANRYQVTSCSPSTSATLLRRTTEETPAVLLASYTQLPESLPLRVAELARQITRGTASRFDKTLRIQEYLRSQYPYDLTTPPAPAGHDLVDFFLFEGMRGYCSHFASAMTVLLRTQGIPARLVSGFLASEYLPEQAAYQVPAAAAHTWVEVYFSNIGWVAFEPTPNRTSLEYSDTEPVSEIPSPSNPGQKEFTQSFFRVLYYTGWTLSVFLGIFLLAFTLRLRRLWQRTSKIDVLYGQIRRSLAQSGFSAAASITPYEYIEWVHDSGLPRSHPLSTALASITEVYVQSIFSSHPVSPKQILSAQRYWRKALFPWLGLQIRTGLRQWLKRLDIIKSKRSSPETQFKDK